MSGIVRRIDDLGRIVIPKEIRKSLKLKNGDELDIEVLNDKLTLKKYSNFLDIEGFLKILINALGSSIKKDILIFDKNKFIVQYSKNIDNILNTEITADIENLLDERKVNYTFNNSILNNDYYGNIFFNSIIASGDVIGGILIFSNDLIEECDKSILNIITKSLQKYIEE